MFACTQKAFSVLLFLLVALSGCAKNYVGVTYETDPPGAVIFKDGEPLGYSPHTINYDLSEEEKASGTKNIPGVVALWYSGAVANVEDSSVSTDGVAIHIARPADVPGLEDDIRIGEEMERERLAKNTQDVLKGIAAAVMVGALVYCMAEGGDLAGGTVRPVAVQGYCRGNGTYVAPHYRTAPDGNPYNNWSTVGNVNPYTGKAGTVYPYR